MFLLGPFPGFPAIPTLSPRDEHDEDGVLISDEFTNPPKRRAMMEKRMRKMAGIEAAVAPPAMIGSARRGRHADRLGVHRRA